VSQPENGRREALVCHNQKKTFKEHSRFLPSAFTGTEKRVLVTALTIKPGRSKKQVENRFTSVK
jgi:hypothetical protein